MSIGRDQVINLWSLKTNTLLTSFPVYDAIEGGGYIHTETCDYVFTAGQKGDFKLYQMKHINNTFQLCQTIDICNDGIVDICRNGNALDLVTVDHNIHTLAFDSELGQYTESGKYFLVYYSHR